MNYWHMQLFPGDRSDDFDPQVIRSLLSEKSVIGLGVGDDSDPKAVNFIQKMEIGDIVAIKHGGYPIALVKVLSEAQETEDVNPELDWFKLRREVEVLDYYRSQYDFKIPQVRGTLSLCSDINTSTSQVIRSWHHEYLKKQKMQASKLSPQRIDELKNLWNGFKSDQSNAVIEEVVKETKILTEQWGIYKNKIISGDLTLENYTNRKGLDMATMPGGYFCNFLERDTSKLFGSSKPGNANNFEVKLNEDNTTYTIRKELNRGDKENKNTKERAEEFYNREIKPLIRKIVNTTAIIDQIEIIEKSKYAAKQILRKIAVLDRRYEYLSIYADATIDELYNEFIGLDDDSNLAKNHAIRSVINKALNIQDTIEENYLISRFLWLYANTKGIADVNSPNVILYGPPGTGKTYSVKRSLDFICQGDRERYEFIQFHPSFTYEDFIEGIKPKGVSKDGNIRFELVDGIFKRFCKKAKSNINKDYYFVVDEINRANLSSVFGETLVCLEKDYRHDGVSMDNLIKTQYASLIEDMIEDDPQKNESLAYHYDSQGKNAYFGVPKNVFFIGMMNDVDKSIDAFDLALRRRFKWIRKDCDYEVIEIEVKFRNKDDFSNIDQYVKACKNLNTYISEDLGMGSSYEFGHSFFMKISDIANSKNISLKNLKDLFTLHLKPTLKEYLRALYTESELDNKLEMALERFKKPLTKSK